MRDADLGTGLIDRAGIPARLFPALRQPGDVIGDLLPEVAARPGCRAARCRWSPSARTTPRRPWPACPPRGRNFAYISCGTWSLVGMELDRPVLTEASRAANFTNETGVDGTVRYLRNVMGLWLLQESLRTWAAAGAADLDAAGAGGAAAAAARP